ncbi:glycoside hydrolase family 2 TIM barrel-domain containing protein [Flaviaesturariibacter amylovorans]|uniref:Glycoside hydrolase family 2 TIM barrel-domain containing protein n=1 Tax=Flaviaesturariibacter amylovorans TaxID=1084520 RepID=A0ABP8H6D4_9BACT
MRALFIFASWLFLLTASAQRIKTSVNSNWWFCKGDSSSGHWQQVTIPHTWNAADVLDDEPGYYRGAGWYKRLLSVSPAWKGKTIHLYFEGANQVATVFVNGKKAGTHTGGYSAFSIPIGHLLRFDSSATDEVVIHLTNAHDENIPPLNADFSFFGGIYRDVYLLAADEVHFDLDNYGSSGVFVSTPRVSEQWADVQVKGLIENAGATPRLLQVHTEIYDDRGARVAQQQADLTVGAFGKVPFLAFFSRLQQPRLWSPDKPNLYRVLTRIIDRNSGVTTDETAHPLGFRWFRFSADSGFFLNGKHLKLIGANRHQDFKKLGNALPDALHVRDVELLKGMGSNLIRIAHYPQDPAVLEACDRLGLLVMEEIPIVNRITQTEGFEANCLAMQREMIRQHFNHPSVIIWAYMNEVLIEPRYEKGSPEQEAYFRDVLTLARKLEALTRQEDSSRYTLIPGYGDYEVHRRTGIIDVAMIFGWNLYRGWYEETYHDFGKYLDRFHADYPKVPTIITEYGADCDVRLHTTKPQRFDKSMEYAALFHAAYIKQMMERQYISGGAAWNFVDFNSEYRQEATPHMNTKGLMTADRIPKDAYWIYQARFGKEPVVRIGSREWKLRSGLSVSGVDQHSLQPVDVYTNQPFVTAYLNGKKFASVKAVDRRCRLMVPFVDGRNKLEVRSPQGASDAVDIDFELQPASYASPLPFKDLHVSLGDRRQTSDGAGRTVWLPEQEYKANSWGYIGGELYRLRDSDQIPYGSNRAILGTGLDPVYATQRVNIEAFRADVPDGNYRVVLHFAELGENRMRNPAPAPERSFDVIVNGLLVWKGLSNQKELLPRQAFQTATDVEVRNKKGITVSFVPLKGQTILNAIEVIRR